PGQRLPERRAQIDVLGGQQLDPGEPAGVVNDPGKLAAAAADDAVQLRVVAGDHRRDLPETLGVARRRVITGMRGPGAVADHAASLECDGSPARNTNSGGSCNASLSSRRRSAYTSAPGSSPESGAAPGATAGDEVVADRSMEASPGSWPNLCRPSPPHPSR